MRPRSKQLLLCWIIIVLSIIQIKAQNTTTDYYYYYDGIPIYLAVSTDALVVKYDSKVSQQKQKSILNNASIQNLEKMAPTTLKDFYHIRLQQFISEAEISDRISELRKQIGVMITAPVLKPFKGSRVYNFC